MIARLISNNWYSIIINEVRHEFFKSSRGLKQSNPRSPSLFVIEVELLTNLMDLLQQDNFIPYSINRGIPLITHLTYADENILFSYGDLLYIATMMKNLETCEQVSGQMVNKRKTTFLVFTNSPDHVIKDIKLITDFSHYLFPFTYLGCHI